MPTAEQLARLLAIREAAASVALDGETMHVAATDGSCCLDHARERIAVLEGLLRQWLTEAEIIYRRVGQSVIGLALMDETVKVLEATNDDAE